MDFSDFHGLLSILATVIVIGLAYWIAFGDALGDIEAIIERRRRQRMEHKERMPELTLKIEKERNRQLPDNQDR